MKAFGYAKERVTEEGLLELSEVSFQASPEALRTIAAFLMRAADEMESGPREFGHLHLQDEAGIDLDLWRDSPDVIVAAKPS